VHCPDTSCVVREQREVGACDGSDPGQETQLQGAQVIECNRHGGTSFKRRISRVGPCSTSAACGTTFLHSGYTAGACPGSLARVSARRSAAEPLAQLVEQQPFKALPLSNTLHHVATKPGQHRGFGCLGRRCDGRCCSLLPGVAVHQLYNAASVAADGQSEAETAFSHGCTAVRGTSGTRIAARSGAGSRPTAAG
jgi:hypothetical protein